jgi:hypothetical protein
MSKMFFFMLFVFARLGLLIQNCHLRTQYHSNGGF